TCLDGQTCNSDNDCVSLSCENRICVSCRDGKLNQGEEDVDCGGPCTACPEEEIPAPPGCVDKFSSWHILLLLILLVLVGYGADKGYEFYLKKKNKPMPKWLTYIKEEQWVSYTAMAVLAIISILSLIFDNACFEDCLPFKSKYLLLIVNIILITLLIVRVYRLEKGLKPLQLYNKDWKKWLTAFIAVSVLIAGFYLHRFFTKSCMLQYPYYRVHPLMWFLPLFILSVLFLAYLAYKLVKEYSPGLFHAPKFRPEPALKPAPIIMPKPVAAVKPVKPKIMPKPKPLPKAKPVITPVPKPKPAIMPKIRKIIGPSAPVFADLDGMSPALQKVKAQVEGMFVEAYEALDENRLEDAQKIASSISKKYKTLPKELRDDIYSEIMILYNKIEKAI
ncbi:hypothetical protein KY311_03870, partial [Candidatus Woesearchaeota archaeon]|nr:hypothetical protein [Candidatus Woesearchaeota archaeon]